MARPNWEYIRVDVLLPGHPKLAGLSRSARWTLIELWCHCGQYHTDGLVEDDVWKTIGTRAEREAIVRKRLAEKTDGGYQMHDYTGHQRSREEIDALSEKRSASGRKAAAARWGSERDTKTHTKSHSERTDDAMRSACDSMPEAVAEAEAYKNPPARERAAPPGARATRLPDDFAISNALAAWAAENVPGLDYATETMRFRDYWKSAPGAKGRKTDWEATWRNWMRRAAEDLAARLPRASPRAAHQPTHDEFDALRNNWARPLDAMEAGIDPRRDDRPGGIHRPGLPAAEDQPGYGSRLV